MNRKACISFVILAATAVVRGTPVETAIIIAMKSADQRSYHWITAIQDDARFYEIEGRTEKDGYTLVSMPMISAVRQKLGIDRSESHNAIFKGDMDCVIETPEGWKTPEELGAVPLPPSKQPLPRPPRASMPSNPNTGLPANFRYTNLQLNLSHPHAEIGLIIGSYTTIHAEADGVSGTLSDTGARLLLVHPGQNEITPISASGTFYFWIKDGELVRYEVQLAGKISIGTGANRHEISVKQTSTTILKEQGTTTFEVPEEARRKLG